MKAAAEPGIVAAADKTPLAGEETARRETGT